jgi:mannose/cellobiose epimerase-like protein (N-acyl-D-glucosamine 2-epimerase family)
MTAAMTHAAPPSSGDRERVAVSLAAFVRWLRRVGYTSYDQYDFWATTYGIWSKGVYYRYGSLAAPLVLPLLAADWLLPSSRHWVCLPKRFAIADAHFLMGFLALYRATREPMHLNAARALADALLASSIPGYTGHCWGYPFDWQTKRGLWKRDTPLVTTTPYVLDAFVELYDTTGDRRDLEVAASIAEFVATDIHDTPVGDGLAAGYTPFDTSQVVNASAYRAACLAEAARFGHAERYRRLAAGNVRFVLDQQRPDGAWPYSANDPSDQFVDHFHTCFVIQGLYRAYRVLRDPAILNAVERGYAYYRTRLFSPDGQPRPFAETRHTQFRRLELYDHAEALALALRLRTEVRTDDLAAAIVTQLLDLQTGQGYFVTRISAGGIRNRVPYHRWAQAQAFCALARYYEQLGD